MKIIFHWNWAALNENLDNTYFLIEDWENKLQVDCGWWLWLAQKVKRKEISFENIFITHKHTDHILWFFKLIRLFRKNEISNLNIFCSKDVENSIKKIVQILQIKRWVEALNEWKIKFFNIDNLEEKNIWEFILEPINLFSEKMEQFWFLLKYKWKKILFFWDEAVNVLGKQDLNKFQWVDYLICEALMPSASTIEFWWDYDIKSTYHSSAKQAWEIAKKINAKNLILIHISEKTPWWENREKTLIDDAKSEFSWNIFCPKAGEDIEIF